jgi:tetratricopeptide (TPR) repeat protein
LGDSPQNYLSLIQAKVNAGKVVLFIGAGASISAGAPSSEKLTEIVKKGFPSVKTDSTDFMQVCNETLETDGIDRKELEECVVRQFDTLAPTEAHKELTRYNWAAIFTTNFDELIENAYRDQRRLKPCQPISGDDFSINPSDRSRVYLFKLMGSIAPTPDGDWSLVLSRHDHNIALRRRTKYLEYLADFVKDGTIVFMGYSGNDLIAFDIIDEVEEKLGHSRLPFSYALFKQLPSVDAIGRFRRRNIIPIECSFEDFFEFLKKSPVTEFAAPVVRNPVSLSLKGAHLQMEADRLGPYRAFVEILDDESLQADPGRMDEFFRGTNKSWTAFGKKWDFVRDMYSGANYVRQLPNGHAVHGSLRERVIRELVSTDPNKNRVIILSGIPGVGKSTILRRLAYDMYAEGFCPVLVLDSTRWSFDLKLLDNVIVELSRARDSTGQGQARERLKPLLIIDDAPSLNMDPATIRNFFSSRSTSVLVVAAGRDNEWTAEWGDPRGSLPEEDVFRVEEELSPDEKRRIVRHLYNLRYLDTPDTTWDSIIDTEFESSFFATMYSLVYHARKPLTEIIRDEYNTLSGLAKNAFQYICCLHQFNIPVNLELLVRVLKCRYEEFYDGVLPETTGIIFEEQDSLGTLLYSTHHRIIAEKTIEIFFGDVNAQRVLFLDILRQVHLGIDKEREIIEKLMIRHLGPRAPPSRFTVKDKLEFFEALSKTNQIPSLLHHYGILETDAENFGRAEQLLKQSLVAKRTYPFGGESERNILTSLGRLYSRHALKLMKDGETDAAKQEFARAEETFIQARYAGPTNPYPYHAHATMYREMARITTDQVVRVQHLADAMTILQTAEDNLNPSELQPIQELKTLIYFDIGDVENVKQSINLLRQRYNNARGYSLYASLLHEKAQKVADGSNRKALLEEALNSATDGLSAFEDDAACARLRAKIIAELHPQDLQKRYDSLKAWHITLGPRKPNFWLLFQLGVLAFGLDYHYESQKYFRELERASVGHKSRFAEVYSKDSTGAFKEYEGTVSRLEGPYRGEIECTAAKNLKFIIYFRPIRCTFTPQVGDLLRFHVAFTFLGPQAMDIRKI